MDLFITFTILYHKLEFIHDNTPDKIISSDNSFQWLINWIITDVIEIKDNNKDNYDHK